MRAREVAFQMLLMKRRSQCAVRNRQGERHMNTLGKLVVGLAFLPLLSALPLVAQVDDGVDFTTAFAFYAGSTKLPAGSYKITQPDMNVHVLRVTSTGGTRAAFVNFLPTESVEPYERSVVTFRRYGGSDYLDRVSIGGETDGVELEPGKAEVKAAENANAADASTVSSGD
jgi:hypothetical protein